VIGGTWIHVVESVQSPVGGNGLIGICGGAGLGSMIQTLFPLYSPHLSPF
jgi:hypothetical protein